MPTRKKRDCKEYKITNSHISFIKQPFKQNKNYNYSNGVTLRTFSKSTKTNFFAVLFSKKYIYMPKEYEYRLLLLDDYRS